jgi:formamidopyrimidine-DNA glycosylase
MPELPEVENVVLSLKKKVLGKTFLCSWVKNKKIDTKQIQGKKIKDVKRFGKNILFFLTDGKVLFVHLRMSGFFIVGKWELNESDFCENKYENKKDDDLPEKKRFWQVVFFLNNGKMLVLSDYRKFAKVELISEKQAVEKISVLGPDPLLITEKEFTELFKKRKGAVKPLLMNQFFISGIGNIYASEILFLSKVKPQRKANKLTKKEVKTIYSNMQSVLKKAILMKGDSTSDFRLVDGEKGGYQNNHLVYNRKGKECVVCGTEIEKIMFAGRGTYFCPKCQK